MKITVESGYNEPGYSELSVITNEKFEVKRKFYHKSNRTSQQRARGSKFNMGVRTPWSALIRIFMNSGSKYASSEFHP
ncbi:hypothetical protein ABEB36_003780 [Hypothenemus hampei]|uniref:Uncharacterized protein n=1 Tax=Hypothenemus hampei TaxID=57062 RepID=A0ABD1F137_HYPHA